MNKIRRFLAALALLATLIGFSLPGMASASLAHAAFSHHVGAISSPVALKIYGPCPLGGEMDC